MKSAVQNGEVVFATLLAAKLNDEPPPSLKDFHCATCSADAYFRKGWSKQAPHFAARHDNRCAEASLRAILDEKTIVGASTVVIDIGTDVNPVAPSQARSSSPSLSLHKVTLDTDSVDGRETRRGVNQVLTHLLGNPEFLTSAKSISVNGQAVAASDFFVPFCELSQSHSGRYIGVWGELYSARAGSAVAWLNRGDEKVGITLPNPIYAELKASYGFASAADLRHAKFLLIAEFDVHLDTKLTSAKQIALRPIGDLGRGYPEVR